MKYPSKPFRIACVASFLLFLLAGCNLGVRTPSAITSEKSPALTSTNAEMLPQVSVTEKALIAQSCQDAPVKNTNQGLTVCFLNLRAGETLTLQPASPSIRIEASAEGPVVDNLVFESNDGDSTSIANDAHVAPFHGSWNWTPRGGAKTYRLSVEGIRSDKSVDAKVFVDVQVTGLSAIARTVTPTIARPTDPPYTVDAAVRSKILDAYKRDFGLTLKWPALGRKFRFGVEDPWVSTAWVNGYLYEVDVKPGGAIETYKSPVYPKTDVDFNKSISKTPLCKPAGVYTMLVVFLDYGNLTVKQEELMADLRVATDSVNRDYAAYPSAGTGSAPILQLKTKGVVIKPPPNMKDFRLLPGALAQYTGVDPSEYQWVGQVDLDSSHTARKAWGGVASTSDGYAYAACPDKPVDINTWIEVSSLDQLTGEYNMLTEVLLAHEVFHLFGYPASHNWACTDGWTKDAYDQCGASKIPAMLLGWTDMDGDGIPEILDPTPYQ
jgi:hypothetical protein